MPATPLHYLLAYGVERAAQGRLSLPALATGSLVSDIEAPVLFALGVARPHYRLLLHSVLGGVLVGTLLAVLLTVWTYPRLVPLFTPLKQAELERHCRPSLRLAGSALLGVLTHVGVDATHHEYNPLLYPFSDATVNTFLVFGDVWLAQTVVHAIFLVAGALVVYRESRQRPAFWRRMFVSSAATSTSPLP